MKNEMSAKYRYEQTKQLMRQIKKQCLNCGTDLTENVYHDLLCNECRKDGYKITCEVTKETPKNLIKQAVIFLLILAAAISLESIFNIL